MNASSPPPTPCPCDTGLSYQRCCGRWHDGPERGRAPDAVALMRSRYSAFVLDRLDYLLDTWHPSTRPALLEPNPPGCRWLGLQVRGTQSTGPDAATVEFVARHRVNGRATRLHETSRFVREAGRWLYVDGDFME